MRAAVLEGIKKLVVKDVPKPEPMDSEVLIKVNCCGICGTDLKLFKGDYTANIPVILGHEFVGEVIEKGDKVKNLKVGDRVVPDPNESCGVCRWCREAKPCFCNDLAAYGVLKNGGFSEYAICGEKGTYKIPENLDYETASFTEPLSCAVHCLDKVAIKPGETVAIIGAGIMGQILTQMIKNSGVSKLIVISRSEWKLNLAKEFGATDVIKSQSSSEVKEEILKITDGLGVDLVIEAVGKIETVEESFSLAKKGGRIIIFGFSPEGKEAKFIPFDFLSREITLLFSWVNPYTFPRALQILASGKINLKPLISMRLKLENINEGFKAMAEKPKGFMKALVFPEEH